MRFKAILFFASMLLIGLVVGFVEVSLPLYLADLGMTLGEIGMLIAAALLWYALFMIYFGSISEITASKNLMLGSFVGIICGAALFGVIGVLPLAVLSFLLFVGAKLIFELCKHLLSHTAKLQLTDGTGNPITGKGFAFYFSSMSIGMGLGMLGGGLLLKLLSEFYIIFFIGVGACILSFFLYALAVSGEEEEEARLKHDLGAWIEGLRSNSKEFKMVMLINMLELILIFVIDLFILLFVFTDVFELGAPTVLMILGGVWLLHTLTASAVSKHIAKFGKEIFPYFFFFVILTSVGLYFVSSLGAFVAILAIDYFIWGLIDPIRYKLYAKLDTQKRSTLLCYYELFGFLGAALILFFVGALYDTFEPQAFFIMRGGILLICLLLGLSVVRNARVDKLLRGLDDSPFEGKTAYRKAYEKVTGAAQQTKEGAQLSYKVVDDALERTPIKGWIKDAYKAIKVVAKAIWTFLVWLSKTTAKGIRIGAIKTKDWLIVVSKKIGVHTKVYTKKAGDVIGRWTAKAKESTKKVTSKVGESYTKTKNKAMTRIEGFEEKLEKKMNQKEEKKDSESDKKDE